MSPQRMSDFEKKLSQLRPVAPGAKVSRGIEEDLKLALRKKRLAKFRSSVGWAGMAIAASAHGAGYLSDLRLLSGAEKTIDVSDELLVFGPEVRIPFLLLSLCHTTVFNRPAHRSFG